MFACVRAYACYVKTNVSVKEMKHDRRVTGSGARKAKPALHPGGTPSVTLDSTRLDVDVVTKPASLVRMRVASVGDGDTVGMAVAAATWDRLVPNIALYVLVARAAETMPPMEAVTEVLNVYAGVV